MSSEPVFDETFTLIIKVRGTDTKIGEFDQAIHNAIQNLKDKPDSILQEVTLESAGGTLQKRGWKV